MGREKAVVAMSGGVDSSVAAALLVEQGYDVTGIMLKLWRGEAANTDSGCCNAGPRKTPEGWRICSESPSMSSTSRSDLRAPSSPISTPTTRRAGHPTLASVAISGSSLMHCSIGPRPWARTSSPPVTTRVVQDRRGHRLFRGMDVRKDQSYVLWMLSQDKLARARFPVGEMTKSETRRVAADLGLRTAAKPDSQEICFVKGGDLGAYVEHHMTEGGRSGPILDASGAVVGKHKGIARYTVGQRKGLGISLGLPSSLLLSTLLRTR